MCEFVLVNESLVLDHVNFFFDGSLKKSVIDIKLPDFTILVHSDVKKKLYCCFLDD